MDSAPPSYAVPFSGQRPPVDLVSSQSAQAQAPNMVMLPPGHIQQIIYPNGYQQNLISRPVSNGYAYDKYKGGHSICLGISHIVVGLLCIAFNAAGIGIGASLNSVAYGIWGGIWFIITGILGILAGKRKSQCSIVCFFIFSFISFACALAVFITSIIGIVMEEQDMTECKNLRYDERYRWFMDFNYGRQYYDFDSCMHDVRARMSMCCILLILSVIEAVLILWSTILYCIGSACCRACCCEGCVGKNDMISSVPVQYIAVNGVPQQVMFISNQSVTAPQYPPYSAGYPMQMPCTVIPQAPPYESVGGPLPSYDQ